MPLIRFVKKLSLLISLIILFGATAKAKNNDRPHPLGAILGNKKKSAVYNDPQGYTLKDALKSLPNSRTQPPSMVSLKQSMPPVSDQGNQASCVAFSTAAMLYQLSFDKTLKSPEFIYSLKDSNVTDTCLRLFPIAADNGMYLQDAGDIVTLIGDMPYDAKVDDSVALGYGVEKLPNTPSITTINQAHAFRRKLINRTFSPVSPYIQQQLAKGFSVVVALHFYASMYSPEQNTTIPLIINDKGNTTDQILVALTESIDPRNIHANQSTMELHALENDFQNNFNMCSSFWFKQPNDTIVGGHAVVIIGYTYDPSGNLYFLIQNSWGARWGSGGYVFIKADFLDEISVSFLEWQPGNMPNPLTKISKSCVGNQ